MHEHVSLPEHTMSTRGLKKSRILESYTRHAHCHGNCRGCVLCKLGPGSRRCPILRLGATRKLTCRFRKSALLSTFSNANRGLRAWTNTETRSDCARPVGHGPRRDLPHSRDGPAAQFWLSVGVREAPEPCTFGLPALEFVVVVCRIYGRRVRQGRSSRRSGPTHARTPP